MTPDSETEYDLRKQQDTLQHRYLNEHGVHDLNLFA